MELISEERLRKNRIKYFEKKFDEAYLNLEAKTPLGSNEIDDADYNLIRFKDMYPCYIKIIEILRNNQDVNIIRSLAVMELMLYFDRVHRGVIWQNNRFSERKNYSSEFKNIFKDLPSMLYLANLENRKKQIDSLSNKIINTISEGKEQSFKTEIQKNSNQQLENSFNDLKKALDEIEIYDSKKRCFDLRNYDKVNNLQSFQYLLYFFVTEILQTNISDVNNQNIFNKFNKAFAVLTKAGKDKMTTQNWTGFKNNQLEELLKDSSEVAFYKDLSNNLKKTTLLQS